MTKVTQKWGKIIATAQYLMSVYQDMYQSTFTDSMQFSLTAAAYLLHLASKSEEIPQSHRSDLALSAAVAFAMSQEKDAAKSIIVELISLNYSINDPIAVIMTITAPELIDNLMLFCKSNPYQKFMKTLKTFLESKNPLDLEQLRNEFIECLIATSSSYENSLFSSCQFILEQHLISYET